VVQEPAYWEIDIMDEIIKIPDLRSLIIIPGEATSIESDSLITLLNNLVKWRNLTQFGIKIRKCRSNPRESLSDNKLLWNGLRELSKFRHLSLKYFHRALFSP
jgi:hypothetical protein